MLQVTRYQTRVFLRKCHLVKDRIRRVGKLLATLNPVSIQSALLDLLHNPVNIIFGKMEFASVQNVDVFVENLLVK